MLPKEECPGCDKQFKPLYRDQIYCDACRSGRSMYDRDCGEMNWNSNG